MGRDSGKASLNKLSKAGVNSFRSRCWKSATHERTAVDHLFGLVAGWSGAGRRGARSFRLISLIDLLFIFSGRANRNATNSYQAAAGSKVKDGERLDFRLNGMIFAIGRSGGEANCLILLNRPSRSGLTT